VIPEESAALRAGRLGMPTQALAIILAFAASVVMGSSGGGGPGTIICCHAAPDGNTVCNLPNSNGCESGDKAIICRYGAWSDPDGGAAECLPG
jgi:hypothetical protein